MTQFATSKGKGAKPMAKTLVEELVAKYGHTDGGGNVGGSDTNDLLRAAINDALEAAAKVLDDEVTVHRANETAILKRLGGGEHIFCENYGCSSLEEFATKIRALKGTANG
jgi:hypothetical protein